MRALGTSQENLLTTLLTPVPAHTQERYGLEELLRIARERNPAVQGLEARRTRVEASAQRVRSGILEVECEVRVHFYRILFLQEQLRLARQTIELFREGLLRGAEASMRIAETSYRQGEISWVEYLDARHAYHTVQTEYQQALYDWNAQRAALLRAAGGGAP
ncbi:MAG: TolC family protein [bacterium]